MIVRGYKNQEFEFDYWWDVADCNGRSGKVKSVTFDPIRHEHAIEVETKEGIELWLWESELSFSAPPEEEEV